MNRADPRDYCVDGVAPVEVAAPATEEELCDLVYSANAEGVGIIPVGGRTLMSLGNVPARPCIIVDMTNLNRVVSHNYADLTASFQAGASFGFVSEVLAQQGQFLPIDPPMPGRATVGGTLAAAVSGPLKWHFGHPRDTVIGMKVVQPDGSITKSGGQVVKNVSGYDMSRLHIGGMGSLGIILEASFKLTPIPMYEKTIIAAFDDVDSAMRASMRVFNSYVMPLSLTTFDASVASRIGVEGRSADYRLAVRLGGRQRTLARQVDEIITLMNEAGATGLRESEGSTSSLWSPLRDFGWSPDATPLLNVKLTALPTQIAELLEFVGSLRDSGLEPAAVAEPGFGSAEVSWFGPESTDPDTLISMMCQVRKKVSGIEGSAVVQRCPPDVKAAMDVWGEDPAGIEVMRRMKRQYDPNGIMNPGRFVGRL